MNVISVSGLSSTGLRLPEGLEYDEWRHVGEQLARYEAATQWALGDWLFYGEWTYGRRYEDAIEMTGLAYQTLLDLKYVAGRFDFSRRRENLSLEHHRVVAALPTKAGDELLAVAAENGWSRAQLRAAVDEVRREPGAVPRPPSVPRLPEKAEEVVSLTVDLDDERIRRWEAAAGDRSITEWVVETCDAAA